MKQKMKYTKLSNVAGFRPFDTDHFVRGLKHESLHNQGLKTEVVRGHVFGLGLL